MNYRKDILERVTYILKNDSETKINYAKLAKQFDCDWRTIKSHVLHAKEGKEPPKRKYQKKTDGFEKIIEEKVKTGAPAIAIFNYLVKHHGFTGSYTTIKNYIHNLHHLNEKQATIRFETNPGQQAQVDWKESLKFKTIDGRTIKFNIFLFTLGYSRVRYLKVTEIRDLTEVLNCLVSAFQYIGGVPKEILFDNMRSIIDKSRTQYSDPVFNEEFKMFAKDCGFIPKACVAYRPQTKGKVENTAKLMNRLKVYSGDIHCFADIVKLTEEFNDEINHEKSQAHDKVPIDLLKEEQKHLGFLDMYSVFGYFTETVKRKVSKEALITYEGHKYSVPSKYIGKYVEICESQENVDNMGIDIFFEGRFIKHWHLVEDKKYNFSFEDYVDALEHCPFRDMDDADIVELAERNMAIYDKL